MLGIYPGVFDPVTLGHIDIIERAVRICDEVVVAVLANPPRVPLFSVDERIRMLEEATGHIWGVKVKAFDGLLVEFAYKLHARVIIKGLRVISDFEYEFQAASMNRHLRPELETIYLPAHDEYAFISSGIAKVVAGFNGCVSGLVPECVEVTLRKKFNTGELDLFECARRTCGRR